MIKKKFLSNKRNKKISFAISDALLDWMKRYVNMMYEKNPEDIRYKSISSFIYYILEDNFKLFQNGKSLDDLENIPDVELNKFYESITFKAIIPVFEEIVTCNKYNDSINDDLFRFFMAFRNFIIKKDNLYEFDKNEVLNTLNRFSKYLIKNKLTEDLNCFFDDKVLVMEYKGKYVNLHFEMSKLMAILFGVCGLKLKKFEYIEKLSQYYFEVDRLFKSKLLNIKERKKLAKENLAKIIPFYKILNDKKEHFWRYLSYNPNIFINFYDYNSGVSFIGSKIEEIKKNVTYLEIKKYILKLLENFNWIIIIDLDYLKYEIILPKENHLTEYKIMDKILKKYVKNDDLLEQII